jgi:replicative DNA helicase
MSNIGVAKNIADPASTGLMLRNVFDDEKDGGRRELKVRRFGGKSGKTEISVRLDPNKHYQIVFFMKNREGTTSQYQVVLEVDLARNIVKEIGITNVPIDF